MNIVIRFVWGGKRLLGGKSCQGFSEKEEKGDYSIGEEGVANKNCDVEEKLAWKAEKTGGV